MAMQRKFSRTFGKSSTPVGNTEIRVTTSGNTKSYVGYAMALLKDGKAREITLKALGHAISKAVSVSELVKNVVPELHQEVEIGSAEVTDYFSPLEEGLKEVIVNRAISAISIKLSLDALNANHFGYQEPVLKSLNWKADGRRVFRGALVPNLKGKSNKQEDSYLL